MGARSLTKRHRLGRYRNSEAEAETFKLVHGYPSKHEEIVNERDEYIENLAEFGKLIELEICLPESTKVVPIEFGEDVKLCISTRRNQLYLIGGDQSLDVDTLIELGLITKHESKKDIITLGDVKTISYTAKKVHLPGPKGKMPYIHEFGEEGGTLPCAIYDVINERVSLAGGSYTVEDVGIKN